MKSPPDKRREAAPLAPAEEIDAKDGPAMLALPTDRHRAFVRSLYQVKQGHGAGVKAAKLAGWGHPNSNAQTMATIASRLMHDDRILEAIHEMDARMIRGIAPRAVRALAHLVETPSHRDHARGIAMTLDRVHPAETQHTVKVQHDVTPGFKETAQVHARIAELAAKFRVPLPAPGVIDGEFSEVKPQAAK
jgi:hypothetical protein